MSQFADYSLPSLVARLRSLSGPRILAEAEILRFVDPSGKRSPRSSARAIDALEAAGAFERIRKGLYVNRLTPSPVADMELLHLLRPGAIVSLHSALGSLGILSGAPRIVTGIVPVRPGESPKVGQVFFGLRVETRLFAMPEGLVWTQELEDLGAVHNSAGFPCATAEKALADWVWLSERPRSRLGPPPLDADTDLVDLDLASEMAEFMGVREAFEAWRSRKREHDGSEAVQQNGMPGAGI